MTRKNRQWLINGPPHRPPASGRRLQVGGDRGRGSWRGRVLIRNLYLSFDPALKGWMENIGGYVAPTEIGEVMRGSGWAR